MKKSLTILLVALAGCAPIPPDWKIKGYSREELEAEPTYHAMKAAIINDARMNALRARLDEGRKGCPWIVHEDKIAKCAADQEELEFYTLSSDPVEDHYPVEETAYFCPKENVYYYHYVGGPRKLDLWMGPFRLIRPRHKLDDH